MMKHRVFQRLLSFLLALMLLGAAAVEAAPAQAGGGTGITWDEAQPSVDGEPTEDATDPEEPEESVEPEEPEESEETDAPTEPAPVTDEELIAQYGIPDDWSRPALLFAVRTGLMQGRSEGTLSPTANTTRAEVATMLMRVLRTQSTADLSAFTDVPESAWYHEAIAQAVAAGLLTGVGDGRMLPDANITREQAFAVLARMFGVYGSDPSLIYGFSDGCTVSDWARLTMAGMIEAGYVHGSDGRLKPSSYITRQELAQVLYNLLDGLGTELAAESTGSYALAADGLAAGTVVHGDLLLCNEVSNLVLEDVTVEGRLVIQGVGTLTLELQNCSIGTLSLCRPTTLYAESGVHTLTILKDSTITGSFETLNVHAGATLYGAAQFATVCDGTLELAADTQVGTLTALSGQVTNNGAIDVAEIYAKSFVLDGTGSVDQLSVYAADVTTTNTVGSRVDAIDSDLSAAALARTDSGVPTVSAPVLTMTAVLSGIERNAPKARYVEALWYLDGVLIDSAALPLTDGMQLSSKVDFTAALNAQKSTSTVLLLLRSNGEELRRSFAIDVSDGLRQAALQVRTQNVQAKMSYTAAMYSYFNGSSFSGSMGVNATAGSQVTLLYTSKGKGAKIRLANGTTGWVARGAVSVIPGNYYTTQHYSTAAKEYYVNNIRNWSSNTGYLIWVSLWTQEVNVFKGSKGNWTLVRSDPCSSGANYCPTPVESVTILYKVPCWYYTNYYCHHVSVFDSARGFHSWPIKNGTTSTVYDPAMGWPNSQSCIRMKDEATTWIYDNMPVGTAVEIY